MVECFWRAFSSGHTIIKLMPRAGVCRLLKNGWFRLVPHGLLWHLYILMSQCVCSGCLLFFLDVCGVPFSFPLRDSSFSLQLILLYCHLKQEASIVFMGFGQQPQSKHLYPLLSGLLAGCASSANSTNSSGLEIPKCLFIF